MLSDLNEELVNCYVHIRDRPFDVIESLLKLPNTEHDYYSIRSRANGTPLQKAARFVYLSTLSFNGIHRVNLRGEFNVPYGHKTHLSPSDPNRILAASSALQSARLHVADFASSLSTAAEGDFIYLDPPYTVAHANNGFVKYNARIFSWQDQHRLAELAEVLRRRGCHVVLSNADHESVRRLYPNFREETIQRFSRIAASNDRRRSITESVFFTEGQSS